VYASSAATYGAGEQGYSDDHLIIPRLQPLNPYGISKNEFDKWVLLQEEFPPFWCGLKFFNVMARMNIIREEWHLLFSMDTTRSKSEHPSGCLKSHRPDYEDGKQLRDFIYVKDVTEVMYFFYRHQQHPGIYNLGTGEARSSSILQPIPSQLKTLSPISNGLRFLLISGINTNTSQRRLWISCGVPGTMLHLHHWKMVSRTMYSIT
jgi:nucleoside-diphosphate-sugar epimerase